MSRLLGAAYGVFCMVLLAPPLALMRAWRDVEGGCVSSGIKSTEVHLLRHSKLLYDYTDISRVECTKTVNAERAAGLKNFHHSAHIIMKFREVQFR